MAFGNNHDMHRVERSRVLERKYISRLDNLFNGRAPA
jgi:hypothetical protein